MVLKLTEIDSDYGGTAMIEGLLAVMVILLAGFLDGQAARQRRREVEKRER